MAFKTEEEVAEFIKNIGTEYRFSCFKENEPEGCHLLADYLESAQKDFEGAAKVFKTNCENNNHPKSCFKYGNYNYLGKAGIPASLATAFEYYKKACNLNLAESCMHCGVVLTHKQKGTFADGKEVELDHVNGLKYLEKSCMLGNVTACYFASGLYISGAEGVPKNRKKAAELSEPACNGGNIYACMNLCRMYADGDGVPKDETKSEFFKQKAREIRDDRKRKNSLNLQQYAG